MDQELFNETVKMFDSPEKWSSYLELVEFKEKLREHWYITLKRAMTQYFLHEDKVDGWGFSTWGWFDAEWYLEEFGKNSVILLMGWCGEFNLMVNSPGIDKAEATRLLHTPEFAPLIGGFNRIDLFNQNERLVIEKRNFSFGSPHDGKFDSEQLAWFAGNKTADFVRQIADKVNRFRRDEKLAKLLSDFNRMLKK